MSGERFFVDTAFLIALYSKTDESHETAVRWQPRYENARQIISTEAVLIELGNSFAKEYRLEATGIIEGFLKASATGDGRIKIIPVDTSLLRRGLEFYSSRKDKEWGLTDCISFVVMKDENLTDALTADRHFVQAGLRAMLLEKG